MRKLRVLVLVHEDLVPPESDKGATPEERLLWRTEYDVCKALRDLGHEIRVLGVQSDLGVIRRNIEEFKPHIAFNLLEEFHGVAVYDQHVVSYLELMKTPYTGSNPRGLTIGHDKSLCRKILAYHRVPGPRFAVFPIGKKPRLTRKLRFPLFVKSAVEDASLGISQASVVADEAKLYERVQFVHERIGTDALAEEYIDGREIYVSVMGNQRLQSFPALEMLFNKLPEGAHKIATSKVKWDESYQEKIDLEVRRLENLSADDERRLAKLCKRIYKLVGLTGYARLDLRMTEDGQFHLIEVNPNPDLAADDLFAETAALDGMDYPQLVQRILTLGLGYRAKYKG